MNKTWEDTISTLAPQLNAQWELQKTRI